MGFRTQFSLWGFFRLDMQSVFHRQFLMGYIFSVSLKFEAFAVYSKDEFTMKNAALCLHILSWHFFCRSSLKDFLKSVFIIFISFFDELSNFCNIILTIKSQNRWYEIVSETICVRVLWLMLNERVYLLLNCPKLALNQPIQIQLIGLAGFLDPT